VRRPRLDRIDEAVNGRVCADAQCKRYDGGQRKPWRSDERPHGVGQIALGVFQPDKGSSIALLFFRLLDATKRAARRAARFIGAHAATFKVVLNQS
jgi:hypothetical protein